MSKNPDRKKAQRKRPPSDGNCGRVAGGRYKNSLAVLKMLISEDNLDRALGEISRHIISLMKLNMFAVFIADGPGREFKLLRAETEQGQFKHTRGLEFPIGRSENVDSWISSLSSGGITEYDASQFQEILIELAGEDAISEDLLGAVVNKRASEKWRKIFVASGESREGLTTFCVFVYSRKVPRTHPEMMKELAENVGIGVAAGILEDRLRERLIKYETIVETQARSFFLIRKGKIEFFSRHLPAILGKKPSEVKGMPVSDFFKRDNADELLEVVGSFSKNGRRPGRKYFRVMNVAGSSKEVEVQLETVYFKGEPAVRGTISDISESTHLEKRLLREKYMEDIATMAGGVAHDFNNLIGAMIGYSSVVRKSLPEYDRRVRQLDKIEEAGIRARKLTNQLLSISRRGKYKLEVVDIESVIRRVVKGCVVPLEEISFNITNNADSPNVEGDSSQLYEAFLNICMNAKEAMPDGGEIAISIDNLKLEPGSRAMVERMEGGDYVRVEVRDEGTGIGEDVLSRAEVPFFTTKEGSSHKGLGLPAAKGIVENHRGRMIISNTGDSGAMVEVYLPVTSKTAEPVVQHSEERARESMKVLVVDDEEIVCELASEMLRTLGHRAYLALSGREALGLLKDEDFDLVVLDLIMPEMNGQELFRRIRASYPNLPVIISSGYSEDHVVSRLLRNGAVSFLNKPYRLDDFSSVIDRVFMSYGGKEPGE